MIKFLISRIIFWQIVDFEQVFSIRVSYRIIFKILFSFLSRQLARAIKKILRFIKKIKKNLQSLQPDILLNSEPVRTPSIIL